MNSERSFVIHCSRRCYFEGERSLMLFNTYNQGNCIQECQFNWTKSVCGCVKYDLIRDKNAIICTHKNIDCAYDIEYKSRIVHNSDEMLACNCLSSCNSFSYDYDVITENFETENTSYSFFSTSFSFYFGDTEYTAIRRYASFGTVDLLSNIGGLFGLFLGISLLSVIETIYFFTFRLFFDFWMKR